MVQLKFPEVEVSRHIFHNFQTDNILPLIKHVRRKTCSRARLSMPVVGQINLLNMVLVAQNSLCYLLAPLYLPHTIFNKLNSILNSFIWREGWAKLAWKTLKNPWVYADQFVQNSDTLSESQIQPIYSIMLWHNIVYVSMTYMTDTGYSFTNSVLHWPWRVPETEGFVFPAQQYAI